MTSQFVADQLERRGSLRGGLRRLLPRDRRFFSLFNRQAQLCVEGVDTLSRLLSDVRDPDGRVREIEALEKRADGVVTETLALLRRSLLAPFPRAAIHALIHRLDDILDLTEDIAQSLHLYHVTAVTPDAQRLAELALASTRSLERAVAALATADDPRALLASCEEVHSLEAQADHVMRSAMSRLFRQEPDTRQLVKLKAIYELLEKLTDRCKDAAAQVEALALR